MRGCRVYKLAKQTTCSLHLISFLVGIVFSSPALAILDHPINTWGYLEHTHRLLDNEEEGDVTQDITTIQTNLATYLWKPWAVQLMGGLALSYSSSELDDDSQEGQFITGEGQIQILPRSYFPFNAFFQHRDNRVDADLTDSDIDFTRTSYGFQQAYHPPRGAAYGLDYRHTVWEEFRASSGVVGNNFSETEEDELRFTFSHRINSHQFNFEAGVERDDSSINKLRETEIVNLLRHRYGGKYLSLDNTAFYTDNDLKDGIFSSERSRLQFNSTLFWQPETERPLTVTGSAIASETKTGSTGSESQFVALNAGANYQRSDALSYSASLVGNTSRTGDDNRTSSQLRVGARYSPKPIKLGYLDYRWTVRGDVGLLTDDEEGAGELLAFAGGHSLRRLKPLWGGVISFNLDQQASMVENSLEESEQTLTHRGALGWSQNGKGASTLIRLSASDNRHYGKGDSVSQLINFQASKTKQINRLSSLNGNITIQSAKFDSLLDEGDWRTTTSVDLRYQHRRAFGVPRLQFTSELRVFSNDLIELVGSKSDSLEDQNRNVWSNRLEYWIGRLSLRLRADLTEIRGQKSMMFLMQVRRNFASLN